ncbi:exodeoxyribonuclease VII small subunit [Parahaliea sp. F7430]|uniref:Exodeoxyribonuclease 7 small subunit n=1 Tax=Sediminihaliea albiluteola TaxID=2758564 RepID=A0A7W2TTG2_9GAMM|nr:exodeoxyribonuclease VII small subunit [Sediminihaliea albiluteola]MBA6411550.1 exodeoxyribonuclease VII small subunit [Sediminihaliea albiluteola]
MPPKKKPATFASTIEQLEALVAKLEHSETPLEESLVSFEQGVKLIRQAQHELMSAEQKVQQLLADVPEEADMDDN